MKRRHLLLAGSTALGGGLLLNRLFNRTGASAAGQTAAGGTSEPWGPLLPDPRALLDLPDGFSYAVIDSTGQAMSDGYRVPGMPDAMACFASSDGNWILMRNHELDVQTSLAAWGPDQKPAVQSYNPARAGGVTRVVIDPKSLQVLRSNLALCGTSRNCAGGMSPWGWLSCEETIEDGHGYVFLCDLSEASLSAPRKIAAYGRFRHEAAGIDPKTLYAYLTEDEMDGGFYRSVPRDPARPFEGQLQAMKLAQPDQDTTLFRVGHSVAVDWVPIDDTEGRVTPVRVQARTQGAALVRRGEGLWVDQDKVCFCATAGGPLAAGQIFALDVSEPQNRLTLLTAALDTNALNMPDNIVVSPRGEVFMAEDNLLGVKHLRVLRRDGSIATLARNAKSRGEFAGVCFSPDASVLFANLQSDGVTVAIRGPFHTG